MSLKKKIVLSFLVSAFIIALLSAFLYLNFVEIKKETMFLELTDTIRSKSLQLRRHEKNYFLYAPEHAGDEIKAIYGYLKELDEILNNMKASNLDRTASLKELVLAYRSQFSSIERLVNDISAESAKLKMMSPSYVKVSRLIESNFLDKPLEDVRYLKEVFFLGPEHKLVACLTELDTEINALRKTGENILSVSKELDKTARDKVDGFIRISRIAILVFFPLFLIVGFGTILIIIGNVVKRLQMLTDVVEKTGEGKFTHVAEPAHAWGSDEVGQLIQKFNFMEEQLDLREKELLRSKKLAAIGTLASGVAHELNNPLNNIYTTAQRLMKKSGEEIPEYIKKGLDDIFGQTMRVKSIVSDLLEFARGRELHPRALELRSLITGAFKQLGNTKEVGNIRFHPELRPEEIVLYADAELLEQVFINLFSNAADAMRDGGDLLVKVMEEDSTVRMSVSDTGIGMSRDTIERIFEPFFTTKDKGTGLGLAIVFNIIQKHQGVIKVESEEGKGTTFIITLPKRAVGPENSSR
ncbi:MAG: HAMP domain-containing histidine kinase [Nitrospirae bacterium]|nr:HAMP domain-containing histidine kinase [Nitrospirota bacterium]